MDPNLAKLPGHEGRNYKIISLYCSPVWSHDVDVGDRTGLGGGEDEDVIGTTVNSMGVYFPKQSISFSLYLYKIVIIFSFSLSK